MKQVLHKPHGTNRFCGPAVLSALTGLSTDDVAAVARHEVRSRAAVKGMTDWEFIYTLDKLGGRAVHMAFGVGIAGKLTLEQWMAQRTEEQRQRIIVATAGNHYLLVRKDLVLCSWTKGEWVNILSHPFRRKRFASAMLVIPPAGKAKLPPKVVAARKDQASRRKAVSRGRAQALRLAARLHLEHERDAPFIITSMAASGTEFWRELLTRAGKLEPGDDVGEVFYDAVLGGDSYGRDWAEALTVAERVAAWVQQQTGIVVGDNPGIIG